MYQILTTIYDGTNSRAAEYELRGTYTYKSVAYKAASLLRDGYNSQADSFDFECLEVMHHATGVIQFQKRTWEIIAFETGREISYITEAMKNARDDVNAMRIKPVWANYPRQADIDSAKSVALYRLTQTTDQWGNDAKAKVYYDPITAQYVGGAFWSPMSARGWKLITKYEGKRWLTRSSK